MLLFCSLISHLSMTISLTTDMSKYDAFNAIDLLTWYSEFSAYVISSLITKVLSFHLLLHYSMPVFISSLITQVYSLMLSKQDFNKGYLTKYCYTDELATSLCRMIPRRRPVPCPLVMQPLNWLVTSEEPDNKWNNLPVRKLITGRRTWQNNPCIKWGGLSDITMRC